LLFLTACSQEAVAVAGVAAAQTQALQLVEELEQAYP
jgi:hypothetical protein